MKNKLTYDFCDDWFIFAKDEEGNLWYVITELWYWVWDKLPESASQENNAIEKYCLPWAIKNWNHLSWRKCDI